nr:immunoglobulin light chain junction region [Macaca mulatta]MPO08331.1 immunoglobulin light chain junction region [Macaca mulatta]
CMMWHNNVVLF